MGLELAMSAVHDYPLDTPRPDFYAVADHFLIGEIPADGACASAAAPKRRRLQPAWDGDTEDPALIAQARQTCLGCPALEACRRYAAENLVEDGFLAAQTAEERRASWTRRDQRSWRRARVRALYEPGATVSEIAEVLAAPQRTVEADIAALGLSGSRRRIMPSPYAALGRLERDQRPIAEVPDEAT
jgi:hypothetical protein